MCSIQAGKKVPSGCWLTSSDHAGVNREVIIHRLPPLPTPSPIIQEQAPTFANSKIVCQLDACLMSSVHIKGHIQTLRKGGLGNCTCTKMHSIPVQGIDVLPSI